jgi:DNA-binding IscR family transcriptional regulator
VRGPRGGYELARERRRVSAGEIVRAAMADGLEDGSLPVPESLLVESIIQPLVEVASQKFLAELDAISVDDLCRQAGDMAVFGKPRTSVDFTI